MNDLDTYIKSVEDNQELAIPAPLDNEVKRPPQPVVQQEVVESVMQMQDEISTRDMITGTGLSVTAEIGTGVGLTYALNRYRPAMKWLRGASHASKLGIITPEPTSTVTGIAGLAASEALIWAGSNLLGQSIRKAYGIQEEYSAGEALAAGVFGTTLVATKADKLIFGLARPAVDDVWKGREMLITTAKGFKRKKFISGAALGLAESAMRQEIEVLMNDDKNRNEYDYLFSALAGGTFNTLFGMWSKTGKWGRGQAETVVRKSKERLTVRKAEAEARLKAAQAPLPPTTQYGLGGGVAMAAKSSEEFDALKQLRQIEEAEEVIDDALNNVLAANKKLDDREANPQPIKDVVRDGSIGSIAYTDNKGNNWYFTPQGIRRIDEEKLSKEGILVSPNGENVFGKVEIETVDTPEVTAPKAPEQTPDEAKLSELSERVKGINSENLTTEAPTIEREAKRLSERTTEKLRKAIATSIKDPDNVDNLQDALDAVVFQRKINAQVIDTLETTGGRVIQAARRDSDKFGYEQRFSYRAAKEDASLGELENSLRRRLEGAEAGDIKQQFDDFLKIRPTLKAQGKAINKKASKKAKGKAKPKPEQTDAQKAQKLKQSIAKKKEKLQKELDEKRARFGDDEALADAQAKDAKPKKPEDPEVKDLKVRIKFYDDAEADVALIEKLEAELDRVVEIDASTIMGAQRAETAPKPKAPTKTPGKAEELRKKIAETRARMRKRVDDIDKAQAQINKEREMQEIYRTYEQQFFDSIEKDNGGFITRGLRALQQARQLALIDQLPSVLAGLPTGVGAMFKQGVRPFASLFTPQKGVGRIQSAKFDVFAFARMFKDTDGLLTAMKRTFKENSSATTGMGGRFRDDITNATLPRGEHAVIAKAKSDAKRRADAIDNVGRSFQGWINTNNFWYILSMGVRGIQSVDEIFKRQIIKGRIYSQALKNGALAHPNDPAKAKAYAEQNYNAAWKDNDGLAVLDESNEFFDEVNQVNEELLFASNIDNVEDVYTPISDQLVKPLQKVANDTESLFLGNILKLIMPYIGVPIRGAFRMAHYSTPGFGVARGALANPYTFKLKKVTKEIQEKERVLRQTDASKTDLINTTEAEIKTLNERAQIIKERRIKYNHEMLTDAFVGGSLMVGGGALALQGYNTGSLEWMTYEQRQKNGLKPFNMGGVNYVSGMPWSGPLAFGADIAIWARMKGAQDETGQPLLTKDQTLPSVLRKSFVALLKEQPLTSGIKSVEEFATGEGDVYRNAIASIVASYVPIPAQARKLSQTLLNGEKTVADLRGATYYERILYSAFGVEPASRKTDRLGRDLPTPRTFITQNITRLAPQAQKERDQLDRIIATDVHGNISSKPSTLIAGVPMTEYRNEIGQTLEYAFNLQLRETRIGKLTIEDKVDRLINSATWNRKFEKGFQQSETSPGKFVNEGLQDLNSVLQKYYNKTRENMAKDKNLLSQFVNSEEESLLQIIENLTLETDRSGRPLSPLDVLGIE